MTTRKLLTVLAVVLSSMLIASCKKDNGDPTIRFLAGQGFTTRDTMMKVNATMSVRLEATYNGTDSLERLDVKQNEVLVTTSPASGDRTLAVFTLIKGTDDTEKWTFVIIDVKGNQSSVSLTLTKDPNSEYGAIWYYSSVVLGAQSNTAKGGFISFQTEPATTYTLEGAFTNQAKMDILYYSDGTTFATLASPGSDIPDNLYPGARSITTWTTKNVSRFLKSTMTVPDFNLISNDAAILNAWSETGPVLKAGNLKTNDIWLVKLASGKKGVALVKRVVAGEAGEIEFAVKMQK